MLKKVIRFRESLEIQKKHVYLQQIKGTKVPRETIKTTIMEANYEVTLLNVMSNERRVLQLCNITLEDLGKLLIVLEENKRDILLEIKNKIIINY